MFSFNNPYGACPIIVTGLGTLSRRSTPTLLLPDRIILSIINGAISATGWANANKKHSMAVYVF